MRENLILHLEERINIHNIEEYKMNAMNVSFMICKEVMLRFALKRR